ncbi:unnamed protein product, partial [Choristocarpus tenellus]
MYGLVKHFSSRKSRGPCYSCRKNGHPFELCAPQRRAGPPKSVVSSYCLRANPLESAGILAGSEEPAKTGRKFKTMLATVTDNGKVRLNAFETWSFDSGASNSVTKDSQYIYDFAPCPQGHNMTVADGTSLPIMGDGNIDLNFNVGRDEWVHGTLTSVAFVQKVAFNLLSSYSASRD